MCQLQAAANSSLIAHRVGLNLDHKKMPSDRACRRLSHLLQLKSFPLDRLGRQQQIADIRHRIPNSARSHAVSRNSELRGRGSGRRIMCCGRSDRLTVAAAGPARSWGASLAPVLGVLIIKRLTVFRVIFFP
jgi:hypothetical protein